MGTVCKLSKSNTHPVPSWTPPTVGHVWGMLKGAENVQTFPPPQKKCLCNPRFGWYPWCFFFDFANLTLFKGWNEVLIAQRASKVFKRTVDTKSIFPIVGWHFIPQIWNFCTPNHRCCTRNEPSHSFQTGMKMNDMTSTQAPNNNLDRISSVRGETGQNIFGNKLTASNTCDYSQQPTWRPGVRVAYVGQTRDARAERKRAEGTRPYQPNWMWQRWSTWSNLHPMRFNFVDPRSVKTNQGQVVYKA